MYNDQKRPLVATKLKKKKKNLRTFLTNKQKRLPSFKVNLLQKIGYLLSM